jgi:hypothetical protein
MYTKLVATKAKEALPILIRRANLRETLTYGELAQEMGWHHRPVFYALGYIRDLICIPNGLPMLSCIVVNGDTHLPGPGFLPEGTHHLNKAEYKAAAKAAQHKVFEYEKWDEVKFS